MQLRNARLCLDCEEVHDAQQCPACASAMFAPIESVDGGPYDLILNATAASLAGMRPPIAASSATMSALSPVPGTRMVLIISISVNAGEPGGTLDHIEGPSRDQVKHLQDRLRSR